MLEEGNIMRCFQCGTCTSSCTTNSVLADYNPRGLIEAILVLGVMPDAEDAWACATCGNCVERCPRGVSAMEVMLAARSRLFEQLGRIPNDCRAMIQNIEGTGRAVGPRSDLKKIRKALGLPDVSMDGQALKQIQEAIEGARVFKPLGMRSEGGGST